MMPGAPCPRCGDELAVLRWSDEWRGIHAGEGDACILTRAEAHELLEGKPNG